MNKSWNPILNIVIDIKNEYEKIFGEMTDNDYSYEIKEKSKYGLNFKISCVTKWIDKLVEKGNLDFTDFKRFVSMDQEGQYVNFKYNKPAIYNRVLYPYNSIYREARGVAIDVKNMELVLTPYRKFFNVNEIEYIKSNNVTILETNPYDYDEEKLETIRKQNYLLTNETSIDNIKKLIKTAEVVEWTNKFDGSLVFMRYYNNEVVMSSSSRLEQEGNYVTKLTRELLSNTHIALLKQYNEYTFVFELISEEDKHIINYNFNDIVLTGMRNSKNGLLLPCKQMEQIADKFKIRHTVREDIVLDDALDKMQHLKNANKEGWVLNVDGNQFKFKLEDYLNLHAAMYSISENKMIRLYAEGKYDDMISKVTDSIQMEIIEDVKQKCEQYKELYLIVWQKYKDKMPEDKKEISSFIKSVPFYLRKDIMKKSKNDLYPLYQQKNKNEEFSSFIRLKELEEILNLLKEELL